MSSWGKVMDPILVKLDVAAKIGGTASWNAKGAEALAGLIREMVKIIDTQIEGRREGRVDSQLHAREMRLFGAVLNDWSKEELLLVVEWQMLQKYRAADAEPRINELRREIVRLSKEKRNARSDRKAAQEG